MLLRRITDFVLQSRLNAIGSALVLTFVPLGGTISVLIAGLVTLVKGAYEGSLVLMAATLPYLAYVVFPSKDQSEFMFVILSIMVMSNIATFGFALMLRHYRNWSLVLESATLIGVMVIGCVHSFYPGLQEWWGVQLTHYFDSTMPLMEMVKTNALPNAEQNQLVAVVKSYATGFVTLAVLMNMLLQLLAARWWQSAVFSPGLLRKELYQIRMGYIAGAVFMLFLGLTYYGNNTVIDIMPVLYLAFCAAGLSLLHVAVQKTKAAWVWLAVVYTVLLWGFPYSVVFIAMIGLLDTWVDFRERFDLIKR